MDKTYRITAYSHGYRGTDTVCDVDVRGLLCIDGAPVYGQLGSPGRQLGYACEPVLKAAPYRHGRQTPSMLMDGTSPKAGYLSRSIVCGTCHGYGLHAIDCGTV